MKTPYTCPHTETRGCPGPLLTSQHQPPATLLARWPSSRCGRRRGPASSRVPAPLRHCHFVFSFKERVIVPQQPSPHFPPAWKSPALPRGLGGTGSLPVPLCWPGPGGGRGDGQCGLSVPNTEPGGGECPVMPWDLGQAGCRLGWAEASDPGRGAARGDIWGRNPTAVRLWCQYNC